MPTMPFGKYRDHLLTEIPEHYLVWLLTGRSDDFPEDLFDAIRAEVNERAVTSVIRALGRMSSIPVKMLKILPAFRRTAERAGVGRNLRCALEDEIIRLSHHCQAGCRRRPWQPEKTGSPTDERKEPVSRSRAVLCPASGLAGVPGQAGTKETSAHQARLPGCYDQ
jgi:hypothetical protein